MLPKSTLYVPCRWEVVHVSMFSLQGGGSSPGGRGQALSVCQDPVQRQGGVQDRQPLAQRRLQGPLWTDLQPEDRQLPGKHQTAGTETAYTESTGNSGCNS